MSEPLEVAERVEEIAPGVFHWHIHNSSIGGAVSSSHAVIADGGSVLVDPVRLADEALAALPPPVAIVLTAPCHQRAAWRYRAELGVEIWLAEDAPAADAVPDRTFAAWDVLPGKMLAVPTPGPQASHYAFLLERDPGVLFCGDLVASGDGTELEFIAPEYQEDPVEAHRSVERLLDLPFTILCTAHGSPMVAPKRELSRLLASAPAPSALTR